LHRQPSFELLQNLQIVPLVEEGANFIRHRHADAREIAELRIGLPHLLRLARLGRRMALAGGLLHRRLPSLQAAVAARQQQRRRLPDLPDAQGKDEALQADSPPGLDCLEKLLRRTRAPSGAILQAGEAVRAILFLQIEDVSRGADQAPIEEGLYLLLAQALYVEGIPGDEVDQLLHLLIGAGQLAGTARHRLAFMAHHLSLQRTGTAGREVILRRALRPLVENDLDDLWN